MNTIIGYIYDGKACLASSTASYVNGIRRVERTVENYPFKILKNGIVLGFQIVDCLVHPCFGVIDLFKV